MKFLIVCAVLICLPAVFGMFSSELTTELHRKEDDCIRKSGASYSSLEYARKVHEIQDTEPMKSFARCMMEKFNVMKSDGSVNDDINSYTIPYDTDSSLNTFNSCKKLRGVDNGETARKLMSCLMKNEIVIGFFPNPKSQL